MADLPDPHCRLLCGSRLPFRSRPSALCVSLHFQRPGLPGLLVRIALVSSRHVAPRGREHPGRPTARPRAPELLPGRHRAIYSSCRPGLNTSPSTCSSLTASRPSPSVWSHRSASPSAGCAKCSPRHSGLAAARLPKPHDDRIGHVLFHPIPSMALFLVTSDIWLIPCILFAAMIDPTLYAIMDLFCLPAGCYSGWWCSTQAIPVWRFSFLARAGAGFLVMFPQIASQPISPSPRRTSTPSTPSAAASSNISPAYDQTLGGLIQWIPPGMMNTAALIIRPECAAAFGISRAEKTIRAAAPGRRFVGLRWTGR